MLPPFPQSPDGPRTYKVLFLFDVVMILLLSVSAYAAKEGNKTSPEPLAYFDMQAWLQSLPDDSVLRYDALKLVTSLQGLVNRDAPR